MQLVTPEIGLIFWQTVTFLVVLFLLSRYAWKPIMKSLRDREDSIQNALDEAATARKEVEELKKAQVNMEEAARIEKDKILKEAKALADKNIEEATAKASKIIGDAEAAAKEAIEKERQAAVADIRSQISVMSVEVAEKLLKRELSDSNKQENLMKELINDLKVN